jgi:hypothetical protein
MIKNVGAIDRIIRIIVGLALIYGGYYYGLSGTVGIILAVLGVISIITALAGCCLFYKITGICTACPAKPKDGGQPTPSQMQ